MSTGDRPGPTRDLRKVVELVEKGFHGIDRRLDCLEGIVHNMPTRQEFDDLKAAIKQAVADEKAQVAQVLQTLQDLRNQLANGVAVTDQDIADLQEILQGVGQIDPDAL